MDIKDFANKAILIKIDQYEALINPSNYHVQKSIWVRNNYRLEIVLTFPVFLTGLEDDDIDLVVYKIYIHEGFESTFKIIGESFPSGECPYDSASLWSNRTFKQQGEPDASWSELDCEIELI
jgi:hypothetical protein